MRPTSGLDPFQNVRKTNHLVREALSDLARAKSDGADEATLELFERDRARQAAIKKTYEELSAGSRGRIIITC